MTIRVVVVDDQNLVRTGFAKILADISDIEVVGEAADGQEALAIVTATQPDVVLLDIRMPRMDGIEVLQSLKGSTSPAPPPRVIILTTFDLDEYVYAALRAGADAFLLKDTLAADLIHAIRAVASGEAIIAPSATRRLLEHFVSRQGPHERDTKRLGCLTPREREVFTLVGQGKSNPEIAVALFLSPGTVKTHVSRILTKLELRDRVQAVILANELGCEVGDPQGGVDPLR